MWHSCCCLHSHIHIHIHSQAHGPLPPLVCDRFYFSYRYDAVATSTSQRYAVRESDISLRLARYVRLQLYNCVGVCVCVCLYATVRPCVCVCVCVCGSYNSISAVAFALVPAFGYMLLHKALICAP